MRLLLDACVWGGACTALQSQGHDVVWAGDWTEDPGDEQILARAYSEARILVTLDKDFAELAIVHAVPHSGILRIVDFSAVRQAEVCNFILATHGEELLSGAIITAEPGRVRVRPPDQMDSD